MRKQISVNDVLSLNLNHLRYFYEVARAGNMRKAAVRIGISQPALSKQIQALEDTIGLQLFYRTPRGLQPTADGEVAFGHCEQIFAHIRDLELALDARRRGAAGRLTVGAIHSVASHILPAYIRRYRDAYPRVRIKITTTRSKGVLKAIDEHRVDVGIIAEAPPEDRFVFHPFRLTPLIVVASADCELARQSRGGELPHDALHRADMVAFDPAAPTRRVTDKHLARIGVEPRVMAECPDISTIKELVAAGVGFAILPNHSVESEVAAGRLVAIPIADWRLERTLYLAHAAGASLSPTVRHFAELFPTLR
jgi:DNA-binding transcriptional LysR family regulator